MPATKIPKELRLDDDQLTIWFNRIKRAYRARKPHEEVWRRLDEYYKGCYFEEFSDEDQVAGSWHLAAVRQMTSQLYSRDPTMNFKGRTVAGIYAAGPAQKLTAYERKMIGASREERKVLVNCLKYGTGIAKYAWNAKYDPELPFAGKKVSQDDARHVGDPTVDMEDVILPQGPFTEHDSRVVAGHPVVLSVCPYDFLVDPEASCLEEARWMAHRFQRPWIDARRDERWDSEAREMLSATGQSAYFDENDVTDHDPQRDPAYQDSSMVTFYEIFDRATRTIIILSGDCEKPLMVRPYPFQGRHGPYADLKFLPSSDSYWGMSYADTFTPQILAMNLLRTQMMDHLQRFSATKGAFDVNVIDPETMERFAAAKVGEYVPVRRMNGEPISNYIETFNYPSISADAWRLAELFKADFQEISGISEAALGSGKGVQTATEASYIERQSGLRIDDMRGMLDDFLEESTRRIVALLRQFYTGQQVFPILGDDGNVWLQTVTQQTVNGEYDVAIEPGSTERVDRNARMRQSIELLQVLTPMNEAMMAQGKQLNFEEVLRQILSNSDIVKNPDNIIIPLPPPPPQPQQPQQPQQQGAVQGQQPAPADVNGLGQVVQEQQGFQNGRQFSEAAGAFN